MTIEQRVRTDELDYDLPPDLIARTPTAERERARLMLVARNGTTAPRHAHVADLPEILAPGTLLVVNDTRVIPARLYGTKPSGGRAEIFLLRPLDAEATQWEALGRASKPIRRGVRLHVADDFAIDVLGKSDTGDTMLVALVCDDAWSAIERHGHVPLPPYLGRGDEPADRERYQTVFAAARGAVAAPTAGLHLSTALLARLEAAGIERASVTLHVGLGTFAPVKVADLDAHVMHAERFDVPEATVDAVLRARRQGRAVLAVGTTVVRALETWGGIDTGPRSGETRLLLQPGAAFRVVDQLLTNFHLPKSTLLALVMAFAGIDNTRRAYATAIAERYRFYSYGDAMLIR